MKFDISTIGINEIKGNLEVYFTEKPFRKTFSPKQIREKKVKITPTTGQESITINSNRASMKLKPSTIEIVEKWSKTTKESQKFGEKI